MGLLWWKNNKTNSEETTPTPQNNNSNNNNNNISSSTTTTTTASGGEVATMNGAEEVKRPRPTEVTVFEFGSASDRVTIAGYCPVSEELEPCRWEILTAQDSDAPQFRVVF